MKTVVVIGTGKIGCGYLAPLFRSAGWAVVLAARTAATTDRIRRHRRYRIRVTSAPPSVANDADGGPPGEVHTVAGIDAVTVGSPEFDAAVAHADLLCTAVGVGNVGAVGPPLAHALAACPGRAPLDVWVVENDDCARRLRSAVEASLHGTGCALAGVGFAGAIATVAVGRGSWADPGTPEFVGDDVRQLMVDATGTVTAVPTLPGVHGTRHYLSRLREKLYVFNVGHAICGYLGWLRGHVTVTDAVCDPFLRPMVAGCMLESRRALVQAHPELGSEVEAPVAGALRRFADRQLADPIVRVARDPIRKLSPRDRLLGPVDLIRQALGAVPAYLSLSIAGALLYRHPGDAQAVELGRRLAEEGVVAVLDRVCGLAPDDPMCDAVASRYRGFIIGDGETKFPPAHGHDLIGARQRGPG